jgi:hypothetical protein
MIVVTVKSGSEVVFTGEWSSLPVAKTNLYYQIPDPKVEAIEGPGVYEISDYKIRIVDDKPIVESEEPSEEKSESSTTKGTKK